jgi:hypothetical protein
MSVALAGDGTAWIASHVFGQVDFAGARHTAAHGGSVLLVSVGPGGEERVALKAERRSTDGGATTLWKPRLAPTAQGGVYLSGMSMDGLSACGNTLPVASGHSAVLALRLGAAGACEWAWTLERGAPLDVLPRASAHPLNLEAASALLVPAPDGQLFIGTSVEGSFPFAVNGRPREEQRSQSLGYDGYFFQLRP